MQQLDPVQFSRTQAQVSDLVTADRAFDLLYHLCEALHEHRFAATSAVLETALDTYLDESARLNPPAPRHATVHVATDADCPPHALSRLRQAIDRMRRIEDGYTTPP
ncbi:hypothetical protein [Gymnodinialimonas ulvae]|uniref:hypothetical protein n=1 Tax=Gymnodinialimonas ulvae TaxID=3126504 RepID=UPI0030A6C119